jgi:hypothetical protein
MSNSRSSEPVIDLFGLVYFNARATRSCHWGEELKSLNPKELTIRCADREVKTRIGPGLDTYYTGKATSGLRTELIPTIYGPGRNRNSSCYAGMHMYTSYPVVRS